MIRRQEIVEESFASNLISTEERNALMQQIEADHQAGITSIEEKAAEERAKIKEKELREKTKAENTFWNNITSLMT